MERMAREIDPGIVWDRILDRPREELRFRRVTAFQEIEQVISAERDAVHVLRWHLAFRWRAYLDRGFDPVHLKRIGDHLRLFLTLIDGVQDVHDRLIATEWGDRKRLEIAVWRDEELFVADLLADLFGVPHYAVARQEPATNMANLVTAPWRPRIYLSFPITAFKGDPRGRLGHGQR